MQISYFSFRTPIAVTLLAVLLSACQTTTQQSAPVTSYPLSAQTNQKLNKTLPVLTEPNQKTHAQFESINRHALSRSALSAQLVIQSASPRNYVSWQAHPEKENLWEELSGHFYLTAAFKKEFKDYQTYYLRHQDYLVRVSKRAKPYLHYIFDEIKKRQMPYEIALLPIVESGYHPFAKSYVSAAGLWQFMPSTGEMFGLNRTWWYDGRQDVDTSTTAALDYLLKLYKYNNGDWLLALASYNSGYGNILKARRKFLKKNPGGKPTFWNIRQYLPKETQHYVPQLLAISHLFKTHNNIKNKLEPVENKVYFKQIHLTKQVDFATVSSISNISLKQISLLNPAYLQPTTPPKGPFDILLPVEAAKKFELAIASNKNLLNIHWAKHTIRSGDSLSEIAEKYHTSSRAIRKLNGMRNSNIRVGKQLLIPVPLQYAKTLINQQPKKYNGKIHTHRVRSGDSLWSIARYYNTSTRTLCEWNRISIRAPLRKGQQLKIRSSQYGKKITYTLKKGESLWTLSKRYNISTIQIARWNNMKHSDILQPGKRIKIWIKKRS